MAGFSLLAGCGSSSDRVRSAASIVPTTAAPVGVQVTVAPAPTQGETYEAPPSVTPPGPAATATAHAPGSESQPGGAGDEQGPTVDAAFTVSAGAISPTRISVPAFFPVELRVKNTTGVPLTVAVAGKNLRVAPGATGHLHLDGLRKGPHAVTLGEGQATLVAGDSAGP